MPQGFRKHNSGEMLLSNLTAERVYRGGYVTLWVNDLRQCVLRQITKVPIRFKQRQASRERVTGDARQILNVPRFMLAKAHDNVSLRRNDTVNTSRSLCRRYHAQPRMTATLEDVTNLVRYSFVVRCDKVHFAALEQHPTHSPRVARKRVSQRCENAAQLDDFLRRETGRNRPPVEARNFFERVERVVKRHTGPDTVTVEVFRERVNNKPARKLSSITG